MADLAGEAREDAWLDPVPPFPSHAARRRFRSIFTPFHILGVEVSERVQAQHIQAFADPWSDRRIAEFACQIPQEILNRVDDEPKRLTRRATARLVPPELVRAMGKVVPTPLFDLGIRRRGRPVAESLLSDPRAAHHGFVDAAKLREAYRDLCADPGSSPAPLWRALSLELWLRVREEAGTRGT